MTGKHRDDNTEEGELAVLHATEADQVGQIKEIRLTECTERITKAYKTISISVQTMNNQLGWALDEMLDMEQQLLLLYGGKFKDHILPTPSTRALNQACRQILLFERMSRAAESLCQRVKEEFKHLENLDKDMETLSMDLDFAMSGLGPSSEIEDTKDAVKDARETVEEARRLLIEKGRAFFM